MSRSGNFVRNAGNFQMLFNRKVFVPSTAFSTKLVGYALNFNRYAIITRHRAGLAALPLRDQTYFDAE